MFMVGFIGGKKKTECGMTACGPTEEKYIPGTGVSRHAFLFPYKPKTGGAIFPEKPLPERYSIYGETPHTLHSSGLRSLGISGGNSPLIRRSYALSTDSVATRRSRPSRII